VEKIQSSQGRAMAYAIDRRNLAARNRVPFSGQSMWNYEGQRVRCVVGIGPIIMFHGSRGLRSSGMLRRIGWQLFTDIWGHPISTICKEGW